MLPSWSVALGDRHDEPEVRLDEPALPFLRLHLAAPDGLQHVAQELRGHVDFADHLLHDPARLAHDVGGVGDLRGGRVEEPARDAVRVLLFGANASAVLHDLDGRMPEVVFEALDLDGLAIDRPLRFLQAIDDVVDVLPADLGLEQALLDGELQETEPLLDGFLAHLRGLGLAELGLELLALADQAAELADVFQELGRALVFFPLGDLGGGGLGGVVVAEHVPRLDLAVAEPLGEVEDVLHRLDEREDGFAHLALAGLDLLGDRDFLLASEERHAPHLLEVHADRIGGLAGCPLGRFFLLGRLLGRPLGLDGLLFLFGKRSLLGDRLDVDVDLAEHGDDLVDLLGASLGLAGLARDVGARRAEVPRGACRLLVVGSLVVPLHATSSRSERMSERAALREPSRAAMGTFPFKR